MATIKSHTDLEQSKKLAEILPLESADMLFQHGEDKHADSIRVPLTKKHWEQMMPNINPCWSLTALLAVYPMVVGMDTCCMYCCWQNTKNLHTKHYDNPVDACYEMIIRLHELNLL